MNLTPVIQVGVFGYYYSGEHRFLVGALGVYDFVTWGWVTKLVVSLTGFLLSVILIPLTIVTAFALAFPETGSLRETAIKTANYIKFTASQVPPQRWKIIETLGGWIVGYLTLAAVFLYIMQLTVVGPNYIMLSFIELPPSFQYPRLDPVLLLPFIPLNALPLSIPTGVSHYLPDILYIIILSVIPLASFLSIWAREYRHLVRENVDAFMQWLSQRKT